MKNKKLLAIAGIAIAAGVASSYASPYITLYQMRSALADNDADSFSSYVDFPSVRESLRAQLITMMQAKMANSPEMNGNPFADLGMVMAMGFVNQAIDTMVTPAGVMTMMAQGAAKPARSSVQASSPEPSETAQSGSDGGTAPQTTSSKPKADYSAGYKNWSTVTATARKGTDDEVTFILKRDGLWSWKLSAVNLPIDKFGSN
ncbi:MULTISPECIES: DUF2939 domain-containing protein [Burkholderia]|uniref:DUF2939 domain-containing protein n=1 Tax=Burkholderia TaxID=32008 RepID=UPI000B79ED08|nr:MULTISPECIES: DUF2939 domain-containing protein [Burkholderia]MBY4727389.1 DUF2939 domain-containing protein [Burkholderia contaminans]MCI3973111.1 DUF2939 domain-containing protein [Burkholderia sp. HI4860]MDN7792734.1 DUF2939 domain-containing protein [Burkholderia contaminans]OXJ05473.1 hypothetical protein CFB48_12495 [Burkholderia sp. AU33647]